MNFATAIVLLMSFFLSPGTAQCPLSVAPLQDHLNAVYQELFCGGSNFTACGVSKTYDCVCSESEDSKVDIKCTLEYEYLDDSGSTQTGFNYEAVTLLAQDGVFDPLESAWADSSYASYDSPQETFNFEGGKLGSCTAAGCISCSVCDDKLPCNDLSQHCSATGER